MDNLNCSRNAADEARGNGDVAEDTSCSAGDVVSRIVILSESVAVDTILKAEAAGAGRVVARGGEVRVELDAVLGSAWVTDELEPEDSLTVVNDCEESEELIPLADPLLARLLLSTLVSVVALALVCVLLPLAEFDDSTGLSRSKPNCSKERLNDVALPGRDICS